MFLVYYFSQHPFLKVATTLVVPKIYRVKKVKQIFHFPIPLPHFAPIGGVTHKKIIYSQNKMVNSRVKPLPTTYPNYELQIHKDEKKMEKDKLNAPGPYVEKEYMYEISAVFLNPKTREIIFEHEYTGVGYSFYFYKISPDNGKEEMLEAFESGDISDPEYEENRAQVLAETIDYEKYLLKNGWYYVPFFTDEGKLQHLSIETKELNSLKKPWVNDFARNLNELMRKKENVYVAPEFGGGARPPRSPSSSGYEVKK